MSLSEAGKRTRRRVARAGGEATAAKRRAEQAARAPVGPYAGTFLEFVDAVGRGGPTRAAWRVFWRAVDGLPLDPGERDVFTLHTGRSIPPTTPAREVVVIAGRRSGKSENTTTRACWRAISRDWKAVLSAGEVGVLPIIAADRSQAMHALGYLKGIARDPLVAPHVQRALKEAVEFKSGVVVRVLTASWRSTRGYTNIDAILEEAAFYQVEGSANPDEELVHALRPAMLTIPDARLYVVSSPYAKRGILWQAYEEHFGKDDSDTLVWVADTASMNPSVDVATIERAFWDDAAVAMAEYGREGRVAFRSDVESFISKDVVEAVVVDGRRELARDAGVRYVAFVDPSGGSQDAMTMAIAHADKAGKATLDCVRAVTPPFSPESVVAEFAGVLKSYGITSVVGDKYGGSWPSERFAVHGIKYEASEHSKSELYVECLPILNAGRCELLDVPKLVAQFCTLERRTGRGTGKDSVDHARGAHDDLANSVAGALVLAVGKPSGKRVWFSGGGEGMGPFDSRNVAKRVIPPEWLPPPELDEDGNP
jgi:hypothetical protein